MGYQEFAIGKISEINYTAEKEEISIRRYIQTLGDTAASKKILASLKKKNNI